MDVSSLDIRHSPPAAARGGRRETAQLSDIALKTLSCVCVCECGNKAAGLKWCVKRKAIEAQSGRVDIVASQSEAVKVCVCSALPFKDSLKINHLFCATVAPVKRAFAHRLCRLMFSRRDKSSQDDA